ncbi:hypothetical protein U3A55_00010 [Salarchaeum sp. III]
MGSDTAKSKDHFCTVGPLANQRTIERTVILADVPISSRVEADVELPSFANDIKHIRKNVHLTQCKVIPIQPAVPLAVPNTTNLLDVYIEGYVHKNIQYSEDGYGYVRDYSVNVPFKCYQRVTLDPGNTANIAISQKGNQVQEVRVSGKDGMGADRCEFGSVTFENLNNPVECQLLRARVSERDFPEDFNVWGQFNNVKEKMTIDFVVRLTQKQRRPDAGPNPGEKDFDED